MSARIARDRLLDGAPSASARARRALALDLGEAALDGIDPERTTRDALARIAPPPGLTVFAFGKAAAAMMRGARPWVSGGVLVAPAPAAFDGVRCFVGGHPDPAPDAEVTGRAFLAAADALGVGDRALALVSGGGSSLLEVPRPPMTLAALSALAKGLRERGASIEELNAVRRRASEIKGGGLARRVAPASILNLVLSDVPGAPPEVVASGPTCAPPADAPSAESVLARYGLDAALAEPATGPLPPIETVVVADQGTARRAVVDAARARGLALRDREGFFDGPADALGRRLAGAPAADAWVWGGETTVTVRGAGRGGRSQEVILGALAAGWSSGLLLALGTDGVDGASPAAGALVDEAVVRAVERAGLDVDAALADNDSHALLDAVGATLVTGPTGTNVADLLIYLP